MRLSAVASDALLGVARSIQLCLIDVLERHRLTEAAYHQHVAEIEEELSEASQRADALQALVVASDAAAVRLERRVDQLDHMLRGQLSLTDHLSGECRDLQLAQLARDFKAAVHDCVARPAARFLCSGVYGCLPRFSVRLVDLGPCHGSPCRVPRNGFAAACRGDC